MNHFFPQSLFPSIAGGNALLLPGLFMGLLLPAGR